MKNTIIFFLLILTGTGLLCQQTDTINIEECFRVATENSPLTKQKSISADALTYKIQNINTNWLPAVGLNAQVTYNSETVDFSKIMKNIPVTIEPLPLDQYKIWADISQQIYDGGTGKAQKAFERASYGAEIYQTEIDLLSVKQQLNQLYFSILLAMKSREIVLISLNDLQERKKAIQSGVEHGVLLTEDLLAIEAEGLKLEQNISELDISKRVLLKSMSILMDTTVSENTVFLDPAELVSYDLPINRPEFLLFEKQKEKLDAGKELIKSADMPKLYAFSQAAYGRPGYNMVSRDFHGFYSVGAGLKWNFLNFGDSKRQKQLLELQKELINTKSESFHDLLSIQMESERSSVEKYNEQLITDDKILQIRIAIAEAGFAKFSKGVITSAEYISERDAEMLARLQMETHRILRLQSLYNLNILQGKI
jgi:outer membrane protein TolC